MCGIVGYIGKQNAVPILIEGLKKLEYRGYDSAGIAILAKGQLHVSKSVGKLSSLEDEIVGNAPEGFVGIGHTRWATHGRPSDVNSHPHTDCSGSIAVVHNGIIENYIHLKEELIAKGHVFKSETDTEVLPHLVETLYDGDLVSTVRKVMEIVEGSYAMVVSTEKEPGKLVAARKDSPLVVGLGDGEYFIASDIPAILNYTRQTYILEDNEIAVLTTAGVDVMTREGQPVTKEVFVVEWDAVAAEKGGYDHFMLKEIYEQPKALRDTMSGRLADDNSSVILKEIHIEKEVVEKINKVFIVACGTAYHAGLVGKYVIEELVRIPVEVDIASEFRYRNPIIDENTLVVVVSQSGETADTLAALREAKKKGARVVAVTNVVGSSVSRDADDVIYTWAGPEIAVASTKAYTTQVLGMYFLGLYLGQIKETIKPEVAKAIIEGLKQLPEQAQQILDETSVIQKFAKDIALCENSFFIGRSLDYAVALEGSLKLKEISYIHAEAYAAGELKHGTLALITDGIPVVALATQMDVYEKTVSNIKEVKARDASVFGVGFEGNKELEKVVDHAIFIPETHRLLAPILTVIPLQLLSYYVSVNRDCDVDKPRNLAKSVTVE